MPTNKSNNHPWDKAYATRQINAIAAHPHTTYLYVDHADERIDERQVNPITVEQVLREGTVIKVEEDQYENKTSWKYRVHWSDKYGWVDVVVKVPTNSKFIVITVIRRETF